MLATVTNIKKPTPARTGKKAELYANVLEVIWLTSGFVSYMHEGAVI